MDLIGKQYSSKEFNTNSDYLNDNQSSELRNYSLNEIKKKESINHAAESETMKNPFNVDHVTIDNNSTIKDSVLGVIQDSNRSGIDGNLDVNVYATKKTIAQGMLDVALLTANASQLKYILQLGHQHEFYFLMVTLISLSLLLQITVGSLIIARSRYNLNKQEDHGKANALNNSIVWLVFGITVINVFISAFGIDPGMDNRRYLRLQASTTAFKNQTIGQPTTEFGIETKNLS